MCYLISRDFKYMRSLWNNVNLLFAMPCSLVFVISEHVVCCTILGFTITGFYICFFPGSCICKYFRCLDKGWLIGAYGHKYSGCLVLSLCIFCYWWYAIYPSTIWVMKMENRFTFPSAIVIPLVGPFFFLNNIGV